MYGEGGDLVDTDDQRSRSTAPRTSTGIQTAQDLVEDGAAVKPDANDPYGTMMTLFKEGKVGMIINGPWEVAGISDDPKFGGFENLGVAPVPAGSRRPGAPVGGHNYVIYSGMDEAKADAAIAFVNVHEPRAESQAFIADELGLLPGNADAYDSGDNERVAPGSRARRRQAAAVDPRGRPVLRGPRRDGDPGADPGRARAGVARRGGRHVQERRRPGLLRVE